MFNVSFISLLKIAYKIAREQFAGRLRETFLVMSDDEPRPAPQLEARRLSLEPAAALQDPRTDQRNRREKTRKHPRESDSMSVESSSNPKKADQTRSAEKRK